MAVYHIAVAEEAKADLSYDSAFERKIMAAAMRAQ